MFMDWMANTAALLINDWFYLTIIALVFWTIDKNIGFNLLVIFSISVYINGFLQFTIPSAETSELSSGSFEFIFPPKEVQLASAFWGFLIPEISDRRYTALACSIIFFTSFVSLLYGERSIQDIIVAILLGIFVVYIVYRSMDWIGSVPEPIIFSFSLVLPSSLLLLFPEGAHYAGLLLGGGVGYSFELIKNRMIFSKHLWKKAAAAATGLVGLLLIVYLESLLSQTTLLQFLHTAFIGLWITLLLPMLSIKLGLHEQAGSIRNNNL
ncbi:hypothetical protein [Alteribacillus bidgolensis]|uniref:PAP2 superfamily protein n=1 Tax=Alteribacillus bidgolensis TaxID=930129 RepID=A0A1G8BNK2_9BACI|nr:hypothetical protein [Alteribacillus bidgolensis]SDH34766.1 hypothetical protein SAMN05216352_10130 [Alteribacillus bidgolensis]